MSLATRLKNLSEEQKDFITILTWFLSVICGFAWGFFIFIIAVNTPVEMIK